MFTHDAIHLEKSFCICRKWHELPEQVITDELKRDLRLLRLRGTMDTKRFYKKADKGKFPTKFAVGTVIEGPTEFFSGESFTFTTLIPFQYN